MTETMNKFTAYNQDVQRYMMNGGCNTIRKTTILETIEQAVIMAGASFEKLFPAKSKRQAVLDEVIYYLSGSGICKVAASTLAEKVGASVRTVSAAVKSMKETGEIIVAGLADGKNKYVFVLKSHPNFKNIMKEVFFVDYAEQIAEQIAEQDFSGTVGAVSVEGQKTDPNYSSSFNSLQERDIIQQSIEIDVQDSVKNTAEARQKLQGYAANEHQLMLFDQIQEFPFPQEIKDAAGVLSLRVGMDCDAKRMLKALKLLNKMSINMVDGVEIRHIAAVFSTEMQKRDSEKLEVPAEKPEKRKPVAFYNWLTDRS